MAAEDVTSLPWGKPSINFLVGDRLHLNHGPIDLIMKAEGESHDVKVAYTAAFERFQSILIELVQELPSLREPLKTERPELQGMTAKRMVQVCWPYRGDFITPMAAVAGTVADEMKAIMLAAAPKLRTLFINNGGDIAVHVAAGAELRIGLVADLAGAMPDGVIKIDHASKIGGIATSGWRGRSFSRGIADAVTVIAPSASEADAAATMIANAVDVESPFVTRAPARELDPDSDLGNILVTTAVRQLTRNQILHALTAGEAKAKELMQSKDLLGCLIALQGKIICLGKTQEEYERDSLSRVKLGID